MAQKDEAGTRWSKRLEELDRLALEEDRRLAEEVARCGRATARFNDTPKHGIRLKPAREGEAR